MCGIAGILRTWQPGETPPTHLDAIPEAWLDILDDSIKHRGPDGKGRFRHRVTRPDGTTVDVALVHRRLSIIDHADGAQPMVIGTPSPGLQSGVRPPVIETAIGHPPTEVGGSGTSPLISREGSPYTPLPTATDHHTCPKCGPGVVAVVFNGCIYNHRELRRELENAGHVFSSDHSDTEVLLHGWREWGHGLFSRIDGMFALAIWDDRTSQLVLARDAFGEKPAYHFAIREEPSTPVSICSSAAGLFRLAHCVGRDLPSADDAPLQCMVAPWIKYGWNQIPPDERIREANTGHATTFGPAGECLGETDEPWFGWWPDVLSASHNTLDVGQLDTALRAAVHKRLEADTPLGCFLSGGIDSALMCNYAREIHSDVRAFTVRMPTNSFDESDAAAITANALGIRHTVLECDPNPATDLVSAIEQLGLPFGDSSLLPSMWVSRAARQEISVAISGDGGDELFMGYDRHRAIRTIARLGSVPKRVYRSAVKQLPLGRQPKSLSTRAARLLWAAAGEGYKELTAIFPFPLSECLGMQDNPAYIGHFGMTPQGRGVNAIIAIDWSRRYDTMFYLPFDLMRKSDTASMRCALEVRTPMLAREVARLGIHASMGSLMPRGQRKGLLRAVARKYLPAEIVDRPKMGFAIPIGEWFRTDYGSMRQLLYDHLEAADPFPGLAESGVEINMGFVQQMLREHDAASERSINPWHGRDHSQRLYMLLVLSIWCRWVRGL